MARVPLNTVLHYIRLLAGEPAEAAETDHQLLECFAATRDEAAFAVLVQRHGPLVWGVCRRILARVEDAEDAFQATFLVLARKAGQVRWQVDVGPWLHAVAQRTALKARAASQRHAHRQEVCDLPAPPTTNAETQEVAAVLDQEVQRLPARYRAPVILHYLEGKTYVQAAETLGCPPGTVAARLARARVLLRKRLLRRGVTVPATLFAAGAMMEETPAALLSRTLGAAVGFAAGPLGTMGPVSVRVLSLTQGVLHAMFLTRIKAAAALVALVGLLAIAGGTLGKRLLPAARADLPASPPKEAAVEPPSPEKLQQQIDRLRQENEEQKKELDRLKAQVAALRRPAAGSEPVLYQGKPAAFWLAQLKDRDTTYRQKAISALSAIAPVDRSVIPVLLNSLNDPMVGQVAASGLASLGKEVVPALLRALKNHNELARLNAIRALQVMHPAQPAVVAALVEAAKHGDATVRRIAVGALGALTPDSLSALPTVVAALHDSDQYVRETAVSVLGNFGAAGIPPLIEALHDKTAAVRRAAAGQLAISTQDTRAALLPMLRVLRDADPYVSIEAAHYFASGARSWPIVPALVEALGNKDPEVRAGAARALAIQRPELDSPAAAALQKKAMSDPNNQVREAAIQAYKRIRGQSVERGAGGFGGRGRRPFPK